MKSESLPRARDVIGQMRGGGLEPASPREILEELAWLTANNRQRPSRIVPPRDNLPWREGLITFEEALTQASNPDDFALKARGISSTSEARWDDFDRDEDAANADEPIKVERF